MKFSLNSAGLSLEESALSARKHFDEMKISLAALEFPSIFVYVAAYSKDHDPEQV
jgi:hypothetical protein